MTRGFQTARRAAGAALLLTLLALAGLAAAHDHHPGDPVGEDFVAPDHTHEQDALVELVAAEQLGVGLVVAALAVAFGLGAVHALSPGHGKTVVAAYLVGSRGTVGHAALLGLIVTATHVSSVLVLGLGVLIASEFVVAETLYPWLEAGSGLLIAAIGVSLLITRLRGVGGHSHDHHDHGHDHHDHDHDHHDHDDHHHDHDDHHHDHDHHDHDHDHHDHDDHHHGHGHSHVHLDARGEPVSFGRLFVLGVTGGIVPCPSALVVLLTAIALHRLVLGLAMIVSFSAGLAAVLIAIGIAVVQARGWIERLTGAGRLARILPVGSAVLITLLGVGIAIAGLRG